MSTQVFTADSASRYPLRVSVGRNVRERRLVAKLSQEQLAGQAGLKQSAISAYERGRARPDVKTLLRLAVGLGTPVDDLVIGLDEDYDLACQARRVQAMESTGPQHVKFPLQLNSGRHIDMEHSDRAQEGEAAAHGADHAVSVITSDFGHRLERIEARLAELGPIGRLVEDLRIVSDAVADRAAAFATAETHEQSTIARAIAPKSAKPRTTRHHQRKAARKAR